MLLDLFCGAGGAAMGYHRAGFDVVGVDVKPQPHYPFKFYRQDALDFLVGHWVDFAAVHASPPCQRFSAMTNCRPGNNEKHPDLVAATREQLIDTGLPYVIENVPGAPLIDPITLCGKMFDLDLYRHRLFETNWALGQPDHYKHTVKASRAGHWVPGTIISIAGGGPGTAEKRRAMGIDWMTRDEMAQAIPPAFTEFVGGQLMNEVPYA